MYIEDKENAKILPASNKIWKAEELNQIKNEIQNVIEEYGMEPDSQDATQLKQALDNLNTLIMQAATNAAALYTDEQITEALRGAIHFTGYIDTVQPDDEALRDGLLWINAADMPAAFPVSGVKQYDEINDVWNDADDYTPSIFDLWSLASDNHGYYWFGGEWNIMDFDVNLADYQTRNEKNQPNGYPGLDGNGQISAYAIPTSEIIQLNGYIGEIKIMGSGVIRPGLLWLDGSEYPIAAFAKFINEDLDAYGIPYGTYTQWQAAYDENMGNVGFIAVDNVNGVFKMPRIDERVAIMQNLTPANIGLFGRDQIVNITGRIGGLAWDSRTVGAQTSEGALSKGINDGGSWYGRNVGDGGNSNTLNFNAANVVASGDRVQPRHVQFPFAMVAANVLVPASQTQYAGFAEGLSSKADNNLSNLTEIGEDTIKLLAAQYNNFSSDEFELKISGLIVKFRNNVPITALTTFTTNFRTPFPNACHGVIATARNNAPINNGVLVIISHDNASFTAALGNQGNGMNYIAFGY